MKRLFPILLSVLWILSSSALAAEEKWEQILNALNGLPEAQRQRIEEKLSGCAGIGDMPIGGDIDACRGLKLTDPNDRGIWLRRLQGLPREDIQWIADKFEFNDPALVREASGNQPGQPDQTNTQQGQDQQKPDSNNPAAVVPGNAGNKPSDPPSGRTGPSSPRAGSTTGGADSEDKAAGEGGLDPATDALLKNRSLTGKEASSLNKAAAGIKGGAESGFGPDREPEDAGGADGLRPGGRPDQAGGLGPGAPPREGSPGSSYQTDANPGRPTASATAPGYGPSSSAESYRGSMSAIPSKYSRISSNVPSPSGRPAGQPAGADGGGSSGSADPRAKYYRDPGPMTGGGSGGGGGSGLSRLTGAKGADRAVDAGPDQLTDDEKKELDDFLDMLSEASKTGRLDPKANNALAAAEAKGGRTSAMSRALENVRAVLEKAGRDWTGADRMAVEAALRRLGLKLSPSEVDKLYRGLRLAYPPSPKIERRIPWWERLLRWWERLVRWARPQLAR